MNPRSTRMLAIAAAVLLLGVILVNTVDDDYAPQEAGLLLPDLETRLNDVTSVTIAAGDAAVTLERADDRWTVADRGGYPADTGKLREALLALADAARLEAKTANAERHAELGLAGDEATRVALSGEGVDTAVILGNVAQRSYRYARLDGADQTWLIDQNPEFPTEAADWLATDLLDVDADDVTAVTIAHADGERIAISASDDVDTQYRVADIPDGRELRYASIVNAVAGVLNGLALEDVRPAADAAAEPDVTTTFRSVDGLVVTARRHDIDGVSWFSFEAALEPLPSADPAPAEDAEDSTDDAADEDASDAANETTPAERLAAIEETVSGWLFRLPNYKRDQLTRRWDDLLKPLAEDNDAE